MIAFFLRSLSFGSLVRFCHPVTLLGHCADKRIIVVNIMKVYIERNNLQLELIRYRKNCWLYSRLLLRSDRSNAISPTEHKSGSF